MEEMLVVTCDYILSSKREKNCDVLDSEIKEELEEDEVEFQMREIDYVEIFQDGYKIVYGTI